MWVGSEAGDAINGFRTSPACLKLLLQVVEDKMAATRAPDYQVFINPRDLADWSSASPYGFVFFLHFKGEFDVGGGKYRLREGRLKQKTIYFIYLYFYLS